jgi:uncharacterized membrane protein
MPFCVNLGIMMEFLPLLILISLIISYNFYYNLSPSQHFMHFAAYNFVNLSVQQFKRSFTFWQF